MRVWNNSSTAASPPDPEISADDKRSTLAAHRASSDLMIE
jgi:hypothetical protein